MPLEVFSTRKHVSQVASLPAAVIRVLEALAVARAPADVREEHDVPLSHQILHLGLVRIAELSRGATVDEQDRGEPLAGTNGRGFV